MLFVLLSLLVGNAAAQCAAPAEQIGASAICKCPERKPDAWTGNKWACSGDKCLIYAPVGDSDQHR